MNRSIVVILILLITVSASPGIAQSVDPVDELKVCARITAPDERYACFDNLSERLLREESADEALTRGKVAQPEAVVTPAAISAQRPPDEESTQERVAQPEAVRTPAAISAKSPPDEKLSQEQAAQPEAVVTPAAVSVQPPPDVVDTTTVVDDQESKSFHYSGRITSCKKCHYGDWFFIFADGQLWK